MRIVIRFITMKGRPKELEGETASAAFRLPKWMRDLARKQARAEGITFSQYMRRTLRRELTRKR